MIPVLTPEEMCEVDISSPVPEEILIARAGVAAGRAALRMLGGTYGRRVVVVAGKGNNGADGGAAAAWLRRRGVIVTVLDAIESPEVVPACDLVVDAAYGTGFRGEYAAPCPPPGVPVLAVDIPSGVDGLTGVACPGAVRADATVTFAALKPGLLLADGPEHAGHVEVADIGLDTSAATMYLVEDADVSAGLPARPRTSHKWHSAVFMAAGSSGMTGAALLAGRAALRAGAGNVRVGIPGADLTLLSPELGELVGVSLPAEGWAGPVLTASQRCKSLVIGPGLGRLDPTVAETRRVIAAVDHPALIDADGLAAVAAGVALDGSVRVLTPHEGEYRRLCGAAPAADRVSSVRALASRTGAVVLLKGATTVVATPNGDVRFIMSGGPRLATAGTGDVLAGIVGAFLARGLSGLDAAALGAHVHGAASTLGPKLGLVASDLVDLLPAWLSAHA